MSDHRLLPISLVAILEPKIINERLNECMEKLSILDILDAFFVVVGGTKESSVKQQF